MKRLSTQGQTEIYQYDEFPTAFRVQVVRIMQKAIGSYDRAYDPDRSDVYSRGSVANADWTELHDTIAEEEGLFTLDNSSDNTETATLNWLLRGSSNQVLDVIELAFRWIDFVVRTSGPNRMDPIKLNADEAISELNARFREHGIGFEYIQGELIRKDSEYLHEEAVKPALTLLGDPTFSGPQDEFLRAHEHFREGQYQDAIVDANNAFESTMKVICTERGWPFPAIAPASKLIATVFDNELLPSFLVSQFENLKGVLESGLPTIRNRKGGHGGGPLPADFPEYMAAYALHLAATSIVLLVEAHKAKP